MTSWDWYHSNTVAEFLTLWWDKTKKNTQFISPRTLKSTADSQQGRRQFVKVPDCKERQSTCLCCPSTLNHQATSHHTPSLNHWHWLKYSIDKITAHGNIAIDRCLSTTGRFHHGTETKTAPYNINKSKIILSCPQTCWTGTVNVSGSAASDTYFILKEWFVHLFNNLLPWQHAHFWGTEKWKSQASLKKKKKRKGREGKEIRINHCKSFHPLRSYYMTQWKMSRGGVLKNTQCLPN